MTSNFDLVRKFHEVFGLPSRDSPQVKIPEEVLRISLIAEELSEYIIAVNAGDIVEIADALADLLYVIYGTGLAYGIPLDRVFAEVQRSNMTKLGTDGIPIKREDGKILKGPNFQEPNIAYILCPACNSENGEPCIDHVRL